MMLTATTSAGLKDQLLAHISANIAFAEPLVFVLGFAESIVFLSLLVPSTVLFLAIGGLHQAAGGHFVPLWLAAASGAFLGDIVSYAIGRYLKNEVAGIWPFSKKPEWYVLARAFFQRWGMLGVVGSKFFGMLRPFVPVVAGAAVMPWPLFLISSAVSCLAWAGAFLGPGHGLVWFMR